MAKYRFICVVIVLHIFLYARSQKESDSLFFSGKLKSELVHFKSKANEANAVFFSAFRVIDKRFDTASFGYIRLSNMAKNNQKMVTQNGLQTDLAAFLTTAYQLHLAQNKDTLVLVLRKFWYYKNYDLTSDFAAKKSLPIFYYLNCKIDCFICSDNKYVPLLRIDTTITTPKKSVYPPDAGTIIGQAVISIVHTIASLPITDAIFNKKAMSYNEINTYYDNNFKVPVLTEPLQQGIYMNFNEFKRNAPSVKDFYVSNTKLADNVYDAKDSSPIIHAWGFCDGKRLFINCANNLFELVKQNNTFSLMGTKDITHNESLVGFGYNPNLPLNLNITMAALSIFLDNNNYKVQLIPMQLDMETGNIY